MPPELNSKSKLWKIAPIVFSLVYLTVAAFFSWDTLLTATIILSIWIIQFGFFAIVRKCMKKDIQDQKGEYRKDLLIGSAGACVISWAVRIAVLIDPFNDEFYYLAILSTPLAFFLFYKKFIFEAKKECKTSYKSTDKLLWIVILINSIGIFVTGEIALSFWWEELRARLFWVQLLNGVVGCVVMLEFCYFWCGRFKLNGEDDPIISGNDSIEGIVREAETMERKHSKFQKFMVSPIKRLFYIKLEEPYPELTITDVIPRVYILVFPPLALIGLVLIFFSYCDCYSLIILVTLTSALIYGGFYLYEKRWKAKFDLSKKNELLIGLGGGLVAAWIPRIGALLDFEEWVLNFICPLLFILFYLHFTVEGKKKWRVVYDRSDKVPLIIGIVNVIALLPMIQISMTERWHGFWVWCHLALMAICTLNSIELCQVWNGKIESGASERKFFENPLIDEKPAFIGPLVHKAPKTDKRTPTQKLSDYLDGKP
uniref:DUF4153 domain-containing protein n=1 Tax=Caenorhabditis tropicalis TaxID=1561998 RepID=A0A1I7UYQ5_9PELO